jgi:hypothetical protein
MNRAHNGTRDGPSEPRSGTSQDQTDAARKAADDRKKDEARYKQNVDRLNRSRDEEIERALSGLDRSRQRPIAVNQTK